MRKRQKYKKQDIIFHIKSWRESGLSQYQYCKREGLVSSTFHYWVKKHNHEKTQCKDRDAKLANTFLPIEVSPLSSDISPLAGGIEINYPNGIRVTCPVNIDISHLKVLISQ